MEMNDIPFYLTEQHGWTPAGAGLRRQIVAHTPELMVVAVHFEKGAVGTVHQHEIHTQISYVAAGSFDVTVGGKTQRLKVGDTFVALPLTDHGVTALEAGSVLVDVFNPRRDDFLAAPKQ
jgi:quercetin dioxygenase-like cupin family protein